MGVNKGMLAAFMAALMYLSVAHSATHSAAPRVGSKILGHIVGVTRADEIAVKDDRSHATIRVRIVHLDPPPIAPWDEVSRKLVRNMLLGRSVVIRIRSKRENGIPEASVFLLDQKGRIETSAARAVIGAGLAVSDMDTRSKHFKYLELKSKEKKLGLWGNPEFRHDIQAYGRKFVQSGR